MAIKLNIPTFGICVRRMPRTTLRAEGQLTLPEEICVAARLEDGDLFDAEITDEGILLRPRKVIDATQAWFWTRGGRRGSGKPTPTAPLVGSSHSAPIRISAQRFGRSPSRGRGARGSADGSYRPRPGWPGFVPTSSG
jgi:hypothetical protein